MWATPPDFPWAPLNSELLSLCPSKSFKIQVVPPARPKSLVIPPRFEIPWKCHLFWPLKSPSVLTMFSTFLIWTCRSPWRLDPFNHCAPFPWSPGPHPRTHVPPHIFPCSHPHRNVLLFPKPPLTAVILPVSFPCVLQFCAPTALRPHLLNLIVPLNPFHFLN